MKDNSVAGMNGPLFSVGHSASFNIGSRAFGINIVN